MTRIEDVPFPMIVSGYESGKTLVELQEAFDVPARTSHSWLVKLNIPRRKNGVPLGYKFSEERNKKLRESLTGRKMDQASREKLAEARKCHFNGLNGYGHTKPHNNGYTSVYCPDHPRARTDGYVMLHTVVMERHIGRFLKRDEVVHHINHDRSDNRIENLLLMNKKDHMAMHMKERHQTRRNEKCKEFSSQAT